MNSRQITLAIALVGLASNFALGQSKASGKTPNDILNRHVAECFTTVEPEWPGKCVNIGNTTIPSLLLDSLNWIPIPAGIALASNDDGNIRFNFHPSSLSVRDVLNSIVIADPRYKWSLDDGVVNIIPAVSSPLLDTRLDDFNITNATSESIYQALGNMPEVRRRAAELGLRQADTYGFIIGAVDTRKYTVHCRNCSIREVLNSMVRQSHSFWIYREYVYEGKRVYRFQ